MKSWSWESGLLSTALRTCAGNQPAQVPDLKGTASDLHRRQVPRSHLSWASPLPPGGTGNICFEWSRSVDGPNLGEQFRLGEVQVTVDHLAAFDAVDHGEADVDGLTGRRISRPGVRRVPLCVPVNRPSRTPPR
jgi:hypothetical protein